MRARGGGAILVGTSSTVKEPFPNLALSNVMRAGVTSLVKTLSLELAPDQIRVNSLLPGRISTDRLTHLDEIHAQTAGITLAERQERGASAIPLGRYGAPDDFGRMGAFLLSNAASCCHGRGSAGGRRVDQRIVIIELRNRNELEFHVHDSQIPNSNVAGVSFSARRPTGGCGARDQDRVRAPVGVDVHAGRASRGRDGRGGGAGRAGHRHDLTKLGENLTRRGCRGGDAPLLRRARQNEGRRARAQIPVTPTQPGLDLDRLRSAICSGRDRAGERDTFVRSTWSSPYVDPTLDLSGVRAPKSARIARAAGTRIDAG
jgi:hypothetical protein